MTDVDPTVSDAVNVTDCRRAATLAVHAATEDYFGFRLTVAEAATDGRLIELLRAFATLVFEGLGIKELRSAETVAILRTTVAEWTLREDQDKGDNK